MSDFSNIPDISQYLAPHFGQTCLKFIQKLLKVDIWLELHLNMFLCYLLVITFSVDIGSK